MNRVRSAAVALIYEGADISADLAPHLLSFGYTDNEHGKADELEIRLEDRKKFWQGSWFPSKGARITASILCRDWITPGRDLSLDCGSFEVDEIELEGSRTGGDVVTIKALSSLVKTQARHQKKTRAWENASFKAVAADVAAQNGFLVKFEGPDKAFGRMDQRNETDLEFLVRQAEAAGMRLKVAEDTVVLFAGTKYDSQPADLSLSRGSSDILSFRLRYKSVDVHSGAKVAYHDPDTKSLEIFEFSPGDAPQGGPVLEVNERVESPAAAQALAAHKLREKNAKEKTGDLVLLGDPRVRAGACLALAGFGALSGSFVVSEARHQLARASGYTTSLNLRKALGY